MADPVEVSGRAFLGLIRHIKDAHGEAALRTVVAAAGAPTQAVFARPIRVMDWHAYPAFAGFLVSADRILGRGDLAFCRELGAFAGHRDLGTVLRVYVALASAERLIRACSKVWPSYYRNAGQMEALSWAPEETRLRIAGFAQMAPAHCRLMEGWMIATMETIGFSVGPGARETACPSRGAAHHEFVCVWTRGRG
jgi:hypothetical protein